MKTGKVFGIGMSRTGTLSLSMALRVLGYSSIHFPVSAKDIEDHESSTDTSVTIGWKFLDVIYLGSRFILTVRDPNEWVDSFLYVFYDAPLQTNTQRGRLRVALFGDIPFNKRSKSELISVYNKHNQEVIDYFSNRPGDMLVMNICSGDGWEKICPFLGVDRPTVPFPNEKMVDFS